MTTKKKSSKPVTWAELSDRERQMLQLVSEGRSMREVSTKLDLSEGTMRVYYHNLYQRIGVQDKMNAARWFQAQSGNMPAIMAQGSLDLVRACSAYIEAKDEFDSLYADKVRLGARNHWDKLAQGAEAMGRAERDMREVLERAKGN